MITEFGEGKGFLLWWGKILSLCRSLWCHSFSDLLARPSFFSLHLSLGQILSSFHLELPVNFFLSFYSPYLFLISFFYPFTTLIFSSSQLNFFYPFNPLIFSSFHPIHSLFSPGKTFSLRGFQSAYIYTRTFLKYKPINQTEHFWAIKRQISGMSCSQAV